jgi:hypothetical protein
MVRVQRRHCRDGKLFANCPPGQTFLIPEAHYIITPEY